MNDKAHLRPQDYDSNGDIIPTSMKETTFDDYLKEQLKNPEFRKEWENCALNEAIKTIRELCKDKGRGLHCTECPMNWNCGEDPAFWKEVKGDEE